MLYCCLLAAVAAPDRSISQYNNMISQKLADLYHHHAWTSNLTWAGTARATGTDEDYGPCSCSSRKKTMMEKRYFKYFVL